MREKRKEEENFFKREKSKLEIIIKWLVPLHIYFIFLFPILYAFITKVVHISLKKKKKTL